MDLLTAKGEAIGAAALIPEGWAMGRITYRDPSAGEATSFQQNTFAPSVDPGLLTVPALFDGADWVTFGQAGESGIGNATTRVHADVQRHVAETLGIDQQRLVRATTENGTFVQTQVSDAAGNLTAYWNEAGTAWGYVYDALGRLREVQLPDGKAHRVSFDGHGRVSRVERQGIATIDYGYEPVTGLLAEKRFTGNTGILRRRITTSHDAIGRVSVETHEDVSTGETRSFSFSYDGGSQLGQLTGVTGQDFQKEMAYRADAKLESRVLTLAGGWRKLRTTFTYNEAGEAASQSTTVEDATGAVLVSSSTSDSFDPYGRLFSTELPGSTLATFSYDPEGLLENAVLAGGNSLGLTYDGLTRALIGTSQRSGTTVASVQRRLNSRALVERDSISVGALTLERWYEHFQERSLMRSTDERAESRYTYSPSGVPTSIIENDVPVQVTTQPDDLGRTILRNDLVMTHGPDGQLAWATRGSAVWTFSYDEAGQRLMKYTNGVPVAAYPEEGYLDASGLVQPVKIAGRTVGLLVNGTFEPRSTDLLGSPIADLNGAPRIASPYGSRLLDGHPARAAALDYVEKGFDPDLGLVRMGVRDYDPELALFITPDPLFLENPDRCLQSPLECNLYAYARGNPIGCVDPGGTFCGGDGRGGIDCFDTTRAKAQSSRAEALLANERGDWVGLMRAQMGLQGGPMETSAAFVLQVLADATVNPLLHKLEAGRTGDPYALARAQDEWNLWAFTLAVGAAENAVVRTGARAMEANVLRSSEQTALISVLRARVYQVAGFAERGTPIIVDQSLGANPEAVAAALRGAGYNARSVLEVFGKNGIKDPAIKSLADVIGGKVVASDRGRVLGEGFGNLAIPVSQALRDPQSIVRVVQEAMK